MRHLLLCFIALFIFTGCASAPQTPVSLTIKNMREPAMRIGIATTALPKSDTHFPGADCLLCLGAAALANSSLTTHTKTLPTEELANIKKELAQLLKSQGAIVKVIDEPIKLADLPQAKSAGPNFAKEDFSELGNKYNVDKLLLINVTTLGMWRTYASYFPTSDPRATVAGVGFIVNTQNNAYDWYEPFNIYQSADGKWDEPPSFPGLTNAYYQAIESAKDKLKRPFEPM